MRLGIAACVLAACGGARPTDGWHAAQRRESELTTRALAAAPPCPGGAAPHHDDVGWLLVIDCGDDGPVTVHDVGPAWDHDAIVARGQRSGGRRAGAWRFWREDGSLAYEGGFADGEYDGAWRAFAADGHLDGTMTFARGTGAWIEWGRDGARTLEGRCDAGLRDGAWGARTFRRGVAEGPWQIGWATGEQMIGEMREGRRDGDWEERMPAGASGSHEYVGDDGHLHLSPPSRDPELHYRGIYRDGRRVGVWLAFTADGRVYRRIDFDADPRGDGILPFCGDIPADVGRCQPFSDAAPEPTIGLAEAGARCVYEIERSVDAAADQL